MSIIEGRGSASSNPASNFRGSRFEDRSAERILTEVYRAFIQSLQASADILIKSSRQTHPSTFLELVSY